jgi:hypothetical protein
MILTLEPRFLEPKVGCKAVESDSIPIEFSFAKSLTLTGTHRSKIFKHD